MDKKYKITIKESEITDLDAALKQAKDFMSIDAKSDFEKNRVTFWTYVYQCLVVANWIVLNKLEHKDLTAVIYDTNLHTQTDFHTRLESAKGVKFYYKVWSPEHKDSTSYAISFTIIN